MLYYLDVETECEKMDRGNNILNERVQCPLIDFDVANVFILKLVTNTPGTKRLATANSIKHTNVNTDDTVTINLFFGTQKTDSLSML